MSHAAASSEPVVSQLRGSVRGRVVAPGDEAYDPAREVYNSMHDRRPAAILSPEDTADVATAVRFAGTRDLPLAVRGGGHSIPGFCGCDGGIVLDLRSMATVEIAADRRMATVGGGATWAGLNDAGYEYGLATPGGVVSTTGVGGLTLGGGVGHLSRAHGLSCDNVVAAEVVLADGTVVRCDDSSEPDLFWGIRGGGGNFGVITSFDFLMHPVRDVVGGPVFFELAREVVDSFIAFMEAAPREFGTLLGLVSAPPLPFLPEAAHGRPAVAVLTCWSGAPEEFEGVLAEIRGWGPVLGERVGRMPYPTVNTLFDDLLPFGLRHYWKSVVARDVSEEGVQSVLEWGASVPTIESGIFVHPIDGAVWDRRPDETAFPHRDARFVIGTDGSWRGHEQDAAITSWVRGAYADIRAHFLDSEYVNFVSGTDAEAVRRVYGDNYPRLARVKGRYDPDNRFRLNQNVPPQVP